MKPTPADKSDETRHHVWKTLCHACGAPLPSEAARCSACGVPVVTAHEQLRPFSRAAIQRHKAEIRRVWSIIGRDLLIGFGIQISSAIPWLVYFWYSETRADKLEWFTRTGQYWLYVSAIIFMSGQITHVILFRRAFGRLVPRRKPPAKD